MVATQREWISDTIAWIPLHVAMPIASSVDHVIAAANYLIHALQNPSPSSPRALLPDTETANLRSIADILLNRNPSTTAIIAPAPIVPTTDAAPPRVSFAPSSLTSLKNTCRSHTKYPNLTVCVPRVLTLPVDPIPVLPPAIPAHHQYNLQPPKRLFQPLCHSQLLPVHLYQSPTLLLKPLGSMSSAAVIVSASLLAKFCDPGTTTSQTTRTRC
jgi:hypothetical protein